MADVPGDRRYQSSHEWAQKQDDGIVIGITSFAAEQLGELVFIDLPKVGTEVRAGEPFGEIESVKAVSELFSPISGKVIDVNSDLETTLDSIRESAYDEGWMIKIEPIDDAEYDELLDDAGYKAQLDNGE
jgi:glycine cleavage system H protein